MTSYLDTVLWLNWAAGLGQLPQAPVGEFQSALKAFLGRTGGTNMKELGDETCGSTPLVVSLSAAAAAQLVATAAMINRLGRFAFKGMFRNAVRLVDGWRNVRSAAAAWIPAACCCRRPPMPRAQWLSSSYT